MAHRCQHRKNKTSAALTALRVKSSQIFSRFINLSLSTLPTGHNWLDSEAENRSIGREKNISYSENPNAFDCGSVGVFPTIFISAYHPDVICLIMHEINIRIRLAYHLLLI